MLGLSIYLSYGYTRSAIGKQVGRPLRTSLALKVAALGFLLVAIGLFTIPHNAGPLKLLHEATAVEAENHTRALMGLSSILFGLVLGIAGSIMGAGNDTNKEGQG